MTLEVSGWQKAAAVFGGIGIVLTLAGIAISVGMLLSEVSYIRQNLDKMESRIETMMAAHQITLTDLTRLQTEANMMNRRLERIERMDRES